jgi:hypothetical protein
MLSRIRDKDIPALRERISVEQGGLCKICHVALGGDIRACLDHDHRTGVIRSVLCLNCNGIEGKIFNLGRRGCRGGNPQEHVKAIVAYWEHHALNPRKEIHPKHRTPDEKRLKRNAKARKRRARK